MPFFGPSPGVSLLQGPAVRPGPVRPQIIRPGTGLPPGVEPWMPGAGEIDPNPVPWRPQAPGWYVPDPSAPGTDWGRGSRRWPPGYRGDGPDYPEIGPLPDGIIRRPLSLYPTYPGTLIPKISIGPDQDEAPERRPFENPRVIPRNPKFNPDAGVPETHPCQEFKRNQKNRLEHNGQSLNSLLEAAKLMKERGDAARRNPGMSAQCLADLLALMAELERAARELRNLSTQNAWDIHDLENTYCVDLVNDRGATRRDGRRLEEMNAARSARIWELQVQLWDLQQRMNALLELCLGPPPVRRTAFRSPTNLPLT